MLDLETRVEDLQIRIHNTSPAQVDPQEYQNALSELPKLSQSIENMRERVDELDKKLQDVKKVADMYGILIIQLQEIRKTIKGLEEKIAELEARTRQEEDAE